MKKTLLSIALIGSAFAASSQVLFSDNFNSYAAKSNITSALSTTAANTDAPGQGNWSAYVFDTQVSDTVFNMVSIGTNDNALKLTGTALAYSNVANSSRTRNIYNGFNWASRTAGNNIFYTSFVFNTGVANSSRNSISFAVRNSNFDIILRLKYDKATHLITPGSGGINPNTGSAGVASYTAATLVDDHFYLCEMMFDKNTGNPFFFVFDAEAPGNAPLINIMGSALTGADLALYTTPQIFSMYVAAQSDATNNAASAEFLVDDITVNARACIDYDAIAEADFSYPAGCVGGTFLNPVLVNPSSTGEFTTTTLTGSLNLDLSTGSIDLSSGTTAGTYDVKFVTQDPYVAGTTPGACADSATVTITLANCPVGGLNDLTSSIFTVFPNPANDVVTVSLADNARTGSIVLTSADGKVIETRNYSNSSVETFNVKSLTSGVYFFQVGNHTERVIVK